MDVKPTPPSTGKLSKLDIEILKEEHECLEQLIKSILENGRLASEIVHRWLNEKNYLLFDKNYKERWYLIPKYSPEEIEAMNGDNLEVDKALCQPVLSSPAAE